MIGKGQNQAVSASLKHSAFRLVNWWVLAAGKQPFTLADTLRPALTECFARTTNMLRGTNQVLEGVFEVAGKVTPVARIQLQASQ